MVSFMILLIIALVIITLATLAVTAGGVIGVVLFGDVFVCIFIMVWIIWRLCSV